MRKLTIALLFVTAAGLLGCERNRVGWKVEAEGETGNMEHHHGHHGDVHHHGHDRRYGYGGGRGNAYGHYKDKKHKHHRHDDD